MTMVNFADPYRARPYTLDAQTAPAFWLVRTLWLILAAGVQTDNRLTVLQQTMPKGLGPPAHFHGVAEGFYVLEGECTFRANGNSTTVGAGTLVHLPRRIPHTFMVQTDTVRVLNFYTPSGFELILMSVAKLALERRQPTPDEAPMPPPDQVRILSRLFGMEQMAAMPFIGKPTEAMMDTTAATPGLPPFHVSRREDATAHAAFGMTFRTLANAAQTDGAYDLFEVTMPADTGLGPWSHSQHQAFYVLEGGISVALGGEPVDAGAGSFTFVPAGTAHTLRPGPAGAKLLAFHLPGGLDRVVSAPAADVPDLLAALGTGYGPAAAGR